MTVAETGVEGQPLEEKSAAVPRQSDSAWVWQVTALSVVLGILLALAINTTAYLRKSGLSSSGLGVSGAILASYKKENDRQREELRDLRRQVNEFQQNINSRSNSIELLKKDFLNLKAMAGLNAVEGPGLKITLRDSPPEERSRVANLSPEEMEGYLIHDQDINGLLNELKAAGAEAIAIAGADGREFQRVVVTTTARCVGPTAVVNGVSLSAPYTILAIGSPKNLLSALEMPDGFVQNRALHILKMIVIEESENLVLPEYAGSFIPKYARPASPNP